MKLHRGEGAYEHAVNSLRKLTRVPERRATIVVSAVISHLNWEEFAELRAFCLEDLGVDRFRATTFAPGCPTSLQDEWPLQPPPFIRDPSLPLPREAALSDFADQIGTEAELKFDRARHTLVGGSLRRNHCGMGIGELAMLSNGDVFPCQLLCKPQFLAGNVFDQPLEQIFRTSPVLSRLRQVTVDEVPGCSTCDMRYSCGGSCRANAMEMHGNIESHNTFQCEFLHRNAIDLLWQDSLIPVKELAQTRERYQSAKQKLRASNTAAMAGEDPGDAGRVVASC
jgi:radical SAM protein with 4Fe4S-binding SPASM domain